MSKKRTKTNDLKKKSLTKKYQNVKDSGTPFWFDMLLVMGLFGLIFWMGDYLFDLPTNESLDDYCVSLNYTELTDLNSFGNWYQIECDNNVIEGYVICDSDSWCAKHNKWGECKYKTYNYTCVKQEDE